VTARHPTVASTGVFVWNLAENVIVPEGIRPYMPFGLVESL